MNGKVFLDSNILIYAYDKSDRVKEQRAQEVLKEGFDQGTAFLSTQVLSEFFVTVTRKIKTPLTTASAVNVIVWISTRPVVSTDVGLVTSAIQIHHQQKISYWDALILAAAERAGCETIYSEDLSHNQKYGAVTVRNPFVP